MISSVDRQIELQGLPESLTVIQTDAAINPGNSGGPLINLKGEVIGINTAKISQQVGAEGMGYSIPSNIAQPILVDLMAYVDRAYLGVGVGTITKQDAEDYGLTEILAGMGVDLSDSVKDEDGVCTILSNFVPGEGAEQAGLQDNDLVISIDGQRIEDQKQFLAYIAGCDIGGTIELRVLRDGKEDMTISATLGER
jgi:serine protease Do